MTHPAPTSRITAAGRTRLALAACLTTLAATTPALAQEVGGYDPQAGLSRQADAGAKNLTLLSITSATVAPHGLGFASVGLSSKRQGTIDDWDGSLALGLGLGSAERGLGVQLMANITSLSSDFGDSGYFQVNLSRQVSAGPAPLYLGAEIGGLATWGQANANPVTGKIMATWFPVLETAGGSNYPLMFTVGYGSHQKTNKTDPAPYFGAGIGLTRNIGASAAWTGETLDIGAAFRFNGLDGVTVTTEINDVTDRLGSRRFTINFNFIRANLFRS